MLYKHIVTLSSGSTKEYCFENKKDSDKAIRNAKQLAKTFGTIKSVCVEPVNRPERKVTIEF